MELGRAPTVGKPPYILSGITGSWEPAQGVSQLTNSTSCTSCIRVVEPVEMQEFFKIDPSCTSLILIVSVVHSFTRALEIISCIM